MKFKANITLEVADFIESYNVYDELARTQELKVLSEFPLFTSVTDEARQYAQESEAEAAAEAIVFKSLAQRILIRFYLFFHKQKHSHPTRIFTDRDKAIEWLNSI